MKAKKIKAEYFKGIKEAEYTIDPVKQIVCGKNGSGKTTFSDMWFWLFTDRLTDLTTNADIHSTFAVESEPSVTAECELNGKDVIFRKYQKDMRTKQQRAAGAPVRISNKYEINGVPKTQKDFYKYLEDAGIDIENFLKLCHTSVFISQKPADCRKDLFGMVKDVTDKDVAATMPDCQEAENLLADYTMEEIIATNKASLKRAKEQEEAIPNQIIGMEKAKAEIDTSLPKQKEDAEKRLAEKQAEKEELLRKSDTRAIDAEIRRLGQERTERTNTANADRLSALATAQEHQSNVQAEYLQLQSEKSSLYFNGSQINDAYAKLKATGEELTKQQKAIKAEKFITNEKCPTCGQDLPKDRIEDAKKHWQADKDARLKDLSERIAAVKTEMAIYKKNGTALATEKKKLIAKIDGIDAKRKKAADEVSKYTTPVTPDCSDIDSKIDELFKQKEEVLKNKNSVSELDAEMYEIRMEIARIIKAQAAELNNAYIDERIEAMRLEQKKYAQVKADAERILYQMQLISRKKNEMLTDEVNSHFERVKFQLFEVQKNGEIKDTCIPLVKCSDGEFRDIRYAVNTAAVEMAKLDICIGLQKFYGQDLPVFIDGAECLDENNLSEIKAPCQLIMLCVSNDERLVFR